MEAVPVPEALARLRTHAEDAQMFAAENEGTNQERTRARNAAPIYQSEITRLQRGRTDQPWAHTYVAGLGM